MKMNAIKIGTRASQLALWQANWVKRRLEGKYPGIECTLERIKTTGDKITDVPLAKVGGKGLFVKEIEEALLTNRVDIAVHSMKDVPALLPDGLHIAAVPRREDFRDVLISRGNLALTDLPPRARIGTSSLRRQSQLLHIHKDFQMVDLRGNLDTRLKKLETTSLDAVIVAAAGIKRMGWTDKISEYLSPEILLPAIGQGALGIETRVDDERINKMISFLNCPDSRTVITAERQFLRKLEGGCQVPMAALGRISEGTLALSGLVASIDGKTILRDRMEGSPEHSAALGNRLAERLLDRGAGEILREILPTTD